METKKNRKKSRKERRSEKAARGAPVVVEPVVQSVVDEPPVLEGFAGVRSQRLRQHLRETDAEERLARCVQKLLGSEELPWNPYPTLARLLRREEMLMALSLSEEGPCPVGPWRESLPHPAQHSALELHLASLPGLGVAWRPMAPMLDLDSLKAIVGGLAATRMLEGCARAVESAADSAFTIRSVCTLTGSHVFAGKHLVRYPRGIELRECVQVCPIAISHYGSVYCLPHSMPVPPCPALPPSSHLWSSCPGSRPCITARWRAQCIRCAHRRRG